ncbi:MAG: TIGR03000 domain-containing protein [Gemmataceae bacterium]
MRKIILPALALGALFFWNAEMAQAQRGGGGRGGGGGGGARISGGGGAARISGGGAPRVGAAHVGPGPAHVGGVHPGYGYGYNHNHNNFWWGVGLGTALGYGLGGWGYPGGYYDYGYYGSAPSYSYYDAGYSAPAYSAPADPGVPANGRLDIEVHVPVADAQVWINGRQSTQAGRTRWFTVEQIYPDRPYQYEIRAAWMDDGAPTTQIRTITVRAGESSVVNFGVSGAGVIREKSLPEKSLPK